MMAKNKAIAVLICFLLISVAGAQENPPEPADTSGTSMNEEIADPSPIDVYDAMANMIRIPGGKVPSAPHHSLSIIDTNLKDKICSPFYIDKYEVTNRQFAKFLTEMDSAEKYFDPRMEIMKISPREYLAKRGKANYPAAYVDWFGAYAFARWAGKSLPTVEEWIVAGLGNRNVPETGLIFPWGIDVPDSTMVNGLNPTAFPGPREVGSFPNGATPDGVMDMAGNVAEWTVTERAHDNPDTLSVRLIAIKGGSFLDPRENMTLFSQTFRNPNERLSSVGFRCIKREQ
jgi:formylglycine-generating enzyme required for sulfatase activity